MLLELEAKTRGVSSTSRLESKLHVCKKDRSFSSSGVPLQKPAMSSLPKSQVLGKVKDFLGVLSESNKRLMEEAKERPDNYDIEVLSGNESNFIEMDLMLGIADLHTPEAVTAAESAMAGYQQIAHSAESSSSSEDEDSSSDDENEIDEHDAKARSEPLNLGPKDADGDSSCQASEEQKPKKRPKIVVIA